jgi:hypothetical protein
MSGGVSASTVAAVAAGGSAVIGAMGAIQQGNAASAAAGYNAKVAAQNAEMARRNADFAGAQGEQNVAAAGMESKARLAAIEAEQGASGVDVGGKSFSQVRQSSSKLGMLNALNIRSEAARKAYGFQTDAVNYEAQGKLSKMQGKAAKTAGYINAASTILGGVSSAASSYQGYLGKTDSVGLTSAAPQYGPYDNSLPWRNIPTGA